MVIVKQSKQLKQQTRLLTWLTLITLLTGLASTWLFISGAGHNHIGGIHGKFGIAAIIVATLHTIKRFKWFRGRSKGLHFIPTINHDKCVRCGLCVRKCPAEVFTKEGKMVILRDPMFCIQCRKCCKLCPKQAIY